MLFFIFHTFNIVVVDDFFLRKLFLSEYLSNDPPILILVMMGFFPSEKNAQKSQYTSIWSFPVDFPLNVLHVGLIFLRMIYGVLFVMLEERLD